MWTFSIPIAVPPVREGPTVVMYSLPFYIYPGRTMADYLDEYCAMCANDRKDGVPFCSNHWFMLPGELRRIVRKRSEAGDGSHVAPVVNYLTAVQARDFQGATPERLAAYLKKYRRAAKKLAERLRTE